MAAEEMAAVWWQHHPHSCALQVPIVVEGIYSNLEHIGTPSARHSLHALLLMMTKLWPGDVILHLVRLSPECDRYRPSQALWVCSMWGEGPGGPQKTTGHPRGAGPHPTTLSIPAGLARPAVAKAGQARAESRHEVPPCPTGNTISAPSRLPRLAARHSKQGVGKGQGCRTAWLLQDWPRHRVVAEVALLTECVYSVATAMWEVLLSQPLILEKVLSELSITFHYLRTQWRFRFHKVEACIQLLAVSNQTSLSSCSGCACLSRKTGTAFSPAICPRRSPPL